MASKDIHKSISMQTASTLVIRGKIYLLCVKKEVYGNGGNVSGGI